MFSKLVFYVEKGSWNLEHHRPFMSLVLAFFGNFLQNRHGKAKERFA